MMNLFGLESVCTRVLEAPQGQKSTASQRLEQGLAQSRCSINIRGAKMKGLKVQGETKQCGSRGPGRACVDLRGGGREKVHYCVYKG